MVEIGKIEYRAEVTGADEAESTTEDLTDSYAEMGTQATEAGESAGFLGGALSKTGDVAESAAKKAASAEEQYSVLGATMGAVAGGRELIETAGFSGLGTVVANTTAAFVGLSGTLAGTVGLLGDTKDETDEADVSMTLLTGTVTSLKGALSRLIPVLTGLSLSGIMGSVTGVISSFVGWLAAGSAGALGFAAAIGAVLGLFGVWILEITGVLDWIGELGATLRNSLPGWARDGLLAVIGLFASGFAAIGGFIVGFIRGGFDQAFANAREILGIFEGANARTWGRIQSVVDQSIATIMGYFTQAKNWVIAQLGRIESFAAGVWQDMQSGFRTAISGIQDFFSDLKTDATDAIGEVLSTARGLPGDVADIFTDLGDSFSGAFADTFNALIPDEVGLDPVELPTTTVDAGRLGTAEVGGQTIFGDVTFDMPRLQGGGTVAETGIAEVHEGEVVGEPGALVEAAGVSGGGGTRVQIDTILIELSGDFDPSSVSRRELNSLADRVADRIGDKTNRRAGVR